MSGTIRTQLGKAKANLLWMLERWLAMEKFLEKERKDNIDESVKAELLDVQLYEIKGARFQLRKAADKLQHHITEWKNFIASLPAEEQPDEQVLFDERCLKDTPNLLDLVVLTREKVQKIGKLENDLLEEARALPTSRPATPVTPERVRPCEEPWPAKLQLVKATVSATRSTYQPDDSSPSRPTTSQGAHAFAEKMIKPISKIGDVVKQTFNVKSFSPPPGIKTVTNDQGRCDAKGHPQPKEGVGRQVFEAAATQPHIRLPKLTMKEFDGNRTEWPNFWEAFQAAVGSQNISDLYKLQYLRGLVTGRAYKAIEGYNVTSENYPVVVSVLKRRFGDPTLQALTLFAQLRCIPKAGSDVLEWRHTWETINRILQKLEQINEETQHSSVAMDILQKFPESITQYVYDKLDQTYWKNTEHIMAEIDTLIYRNEVAHHVQHPYEKMHYFPGDEPSSSVNVLTTYEKGRKAYKEQFNNQRRPRKPCIFCHDAHWSSSCTKFVTLTARKNRLRDLRKCFKCFRYREPNIHKCEKTFKCFECQGDHVTALCTMRLGTPADPCKPIGTNVVCYDSVPSSEKEFFDSSSDSDGERTFNMVHLESTNCKRGGATKVEKEPVERNSIKKLSEVALLTADAVIASTTNRNVCSTETIFFEFGSQASFVQEDPADALQLKQLGAKKITVCPFASQAKEYVSRIIEFDMKLADGTWLKTSALTVPDLPKNLTSAKLETDENGKKSLKMRKHVSTRILLGADNMTKVMDFPKFNGLSIVKSKLGDLLGGGREHGVEYAVNAVTFVNVDETAKCDVEKIFDPQNLGIPSSDDPYAEQANDDAINDFLKVTYAELNKRYTERSLYKPGTNNLVKAKNIERAQLVRLWKKLQEKPTFLKKNHNTIMTLLTEVETLVNTRPPNVLLPHVFLAALSKGYKDENDGYDFISNLRSMWRVSLDRFQKFRHMALRFVIRCLSHIRPHLLVCAAMSHSLFY
uniref:DUF1758 domain-containing protein n=1 Tax=Panagrellus redivivus TaxID=6233 RepID=A0A7E4USB7_PANRE